MEMLYNLLWQNCSCIFTVGTEILIIANAPSCADACRFCPGGQVALMYIGSAPAGGQAAGNRFYSCGLAALMRAGSAPAGGLRYREPVLFLRIGCADACRFCPGGCGA